MGARALAVVVTAVVSGVNMYAMLTGNLPFTVEPFNIKALHNKMLKAEMNPIPDHLSDGRQTRQQMTS